MTQPSLNKTFDTSLIDLNPSFSTTDSGDTIADPPPPTSTVKMPDSKTSTVQHIPTQSAYDQWASVYDTDGNMLQSIDDAELHTLLPAFLGQVTKSDEIAVLDLGCGTGRNTAKLLSYSWPANSSVHVYGVDFSQGMLDIASTKLSALLATTQQNRSVVVSLELECVNPFPIPPSSAILTRPMNAVISTLVLEHIALPAFFTTLSSVLVTGGLALVTNMHVDMGAVSQAGFVNAEGVKVRGDSWAYGIAETVAEAEKSGFEVVSVRERAVGEEDVGNGVVGARGRKWIGINVWFGIVLRKRSDGD